VEYFVSTYDYYQPEAYIAQTDTYIEKDAVVNDDIDRLRHAATASLLTRRDVIIVASVSCIYGLGSPDEYQERLVILKVGEDTGGRDTVLRALVDIQYRRNDTALGRGAFRAKGDVIELQPAYMESAYRISLFGDEVESITHYDPLTGEVLGKPTELVVYPATHYVTDPVTIERATQEILAEMAECAHRFELDGKPLEAHRIRQRTEYDVEMLREMGYCNGVENYSRFFDRRQPGTRPFCLLDYFPKDFVCIIDESHQTIPQVSGMYGGDRSRKMNLVEYGFRLPSALDNRPLNFHEFENLVGQVIYVSATPGDYELEQSGGVVVEQVVRPTGLLDPPIEVRPARHQVDDLLDEIENTVKRGFRVLVTTLTKRMAEEMDAYLKRIDIRSKYIHSGIHTLERIEILRDLRLGTFDVLVGVNLLREGLDLPEVALVAILDADKEGYLRNEKSLTQTAGRAARNSEGRVIFYGDTITGSMQKTIDETNRRRAKQLEYNEAHGITPTTVVKSKDQVFAQTSVLDIRGYDPDDQRAIPAQANLHTAVAEEESEYKTIPELEKAVKQKKKAMEKAARDMDFMEAARLRDEMFELQKHLESFQAG